MQNLRHARSKPDKEEAAPFYHGYLDAIRENDLIEALRLSLEELKAMFDNIEQPALEIKYAEGKWSVAEVLLHIADAERVFAYRALRFSRADKTAVPGFDQDLYVPESAASGRTKDSLLKELSALRESTISLFESFNERQLLEKGTASGSEVSVRALGYLIAGHQKHHLRILKERYL